MYTMQISREFLAGLDNLMNEIFSFLNRYLAKIYEYVFKPSFSTDNLQKVDKISLDSTILSI